MSTSENNKRIAKNTLLLYVRMVLLMLISLYTGRVTLQALGETDYGIYSVVGGIVVLLSFLNNAMAGATQRFLNVEMGKGDKEGLKRVFSSALYIHVIVAVAILVLSETVGLWFLNAAMNIPADRVVAANFVYQFSVASFLVGVLSVPYNASIIAHEKMSAFAYVSILEAVFKLVVVFLIQVLPLDALILYAGLLFGVAVVLRIVYGIYCKRNFEECVYERKVVDKVVAKRMLSFSSWTIFGNLGYILHTQGIAICINMFFGTVVNAAQGISNTVNTAVSAFVSNFQMALNPQIVKSYAAGNLSEMHALMFRGCRFSFFLIIFFSIPLIVEAPAVIGFWLTEVPEYTIIFVRLVLAISVCNSYSSILATAQGATGSIKVYQVTLTLIGALHVPLALLAYYLGCEPQSSSWVYLVIVIVLQVIRVCFVSRSTKMPMAHFLNEVLRPCFVVLLFASILPIVLHFVWGGGFFVLVAKCLVSFVATALLAYAFGLRGKEREMIVEMVKSKVLRR